MDRSEEAGHRLAASGGALLMTDWCDSVFLHLAVPPAALQPFVPFPLDLREGSAYVSVVAFDQVRFRTPRASGLLSPFVRPFGSHLFCNLRTYVRCDDEPGIFFLREWIPNPFSVMVAPRTYGLPYRLAALHYEYDRHAGTFFGQVSSGGRHVAIEARIAYEQPVHFPPQESLDAFLLERYTAFTAPGRRRLRFRIWHPTWPQHRIDGEIVSHSLLRHTGSWYDSARMVMANYSPGINGVQIGLPSRVRR